MMLGRTPVNLLGCSAALCVEASAEDAWYEYDASGMMGAAKQVQFHVVAHPRFSFYASPLVWWRLTVLSLPPVDHANVNEQLPELGEV